MHCIGACTPPPPNLNGCQRPISEPCIGIKHILIKLLERGIEIRRVSKLEREAVHLVDALDAPISAKSVVGHTSRRGIESYSRTRRVRPSSNRAHGCHRFGRNGSQVAVVRRWDKLFVNIIADHPAFAIKLGIEEILIRVVALSFVVAPGIQYVARRRMDIHVKANIRKLLVNGHDVFGLRFRLGRSPTEGLRAWRRRGRVRRGIKVLLEIPEEIEIAIDVDPSGTSVAGRSVSVLAP
ncbi:unnamed protein product [Periconia digitata]|uniref:Uncharacterized protein n=1 Tax=Periconia digitata TaxID=1303443 RepID=A0A9W4U958_9PLEO|nr:unnamed protein product [Periconia digitata]